MSSKTVTVVKVRVHKIATNKQGDTVALFLWPIYHVRIYIDSAWYIHNQQECLILLHSKVCIGM